MSTKEIILKILTFIANGLLAFVLLFESLLATSLPLADHQSRMVDDAINVLEQKGFKREAFLLRNVTFFRSSDNWLNSMDHKENAFAATNLPFGIVTIYPDFYSRTKDDTERAFILLHESRHLLGENENEAYSYAWKNRKKLGWTQLAYGSDEVYITVELQTREHAPEIFNCPDKLWMDCTEMPNGKVPNPQNTKVADQRRGRREQRISNVPPLREPGR